MFDGSTGYDVTPANAPVYSGQWGEMARTPLPDTKRTRPAVTEFVSFYGQRPRFSNPNSSVTPLARLAIQGADSEEQPAEQSESDSQVAKAAIGRSLLLAKKYGGGVNKEETSRLEILTARLRNLAPRVTIEHADALAEMVNHVEDTRSDLAAIREFYSQL